MSSIAVTATVTGGTNGTTAGAIAYGATPGSSGLASTNLGAGFTLTGVLSGDACTPVLAKAFDVAKITTGAKARLTVTLRNNNATLGLTAGAFTDTYPTGMVNAAVPNASTTCGATLTAAAGANTLQAAGASIAAASSCTVAVDVVTTLAGTYPNTISAGGLTATLVDTSVTTLFASSASVEGIEPLAATKSVTTVSDPRNATSNPKAVPGAVLEYAITITNPSTSSVSTVVIGDVLPADGKLVVADIGSAGSGPAAFTQGSTSSTLAYTFTSLASTTDSLDFSQDNGATWTYAPTADADGADALVTHVRVRPTGSHAAGGAFTLTFRIRVK